MAFNFGVALFEQGLAQASRVPKGGWCCLSVVGQARQWGKSANRKDVDQ